MAEFEPIHEKVMQLEGGYTLHQVPGDLGGMTYAGIAREKWPQWLGWWKIDQDEFDGELTEMVRQFYHQNYWLKIRGDEIKSQDVAFAIYGCSVNTGRTTTTRVVQQICGVAVDGYLGPKTLDALNDLLEDEKDERIFILLFALLRVFRYKDICQKDKRRHQDQVGSNLKFLCGWINRVQRGLA
ncbi:glycosyl hydrolase 108 family protein [Desulfosediminicola sp.]|uniref:glycosyl hydrolase 108 family protein n=1 Tax=Desulfosediminicola sp. TaxID=2886825 RepID=UPI003AF21EAB